MESKTNNNGVANGAAALPPAPTVDDSPAPLLPHLESLERMMRIPVVEAAWNQSTGVYGKVKDSNAMLSWALGTAESTVQRALSTASPLIQKMDRPIQLVDQTLVKGIDKLESAVPVVKEQPQEIYKQTKEAITRTVQGKVGKVCALTSAGQNKARSLKELSWNKANEVLATQYGSMAVQGVDSTSLLAEKLLDYYFPATESDLQEAEAEEAIASADQDRVLHTAQTVGRLSNKVARRVYRNVSQQIRSINKQDLHQYIASLIAVLRLTQYLNFLNDKVRSVTAKESPKEGNGTATQVQ